MIAFCPTNSDGYSFAIGLFTYGHIFFSSRSSVIAYGSQLIFKVFVALALFCLERRMREQYNDYRLTIFRWKWILYTVPVVFALGNLLVLIFAAKAKIPGHIPRFWWPATFFLILFGSSLYWGAVMITRAKIVYGGESKTVGHMIGVEFIIYNQDDANIPAGMKDSIAEALAAKIDGSKRRVECRVCGIRFPHFHFPRPAS
jgi:hypothetical protein